MNYACRSDVVAAAETPESLAKRVEAARIPIDRAKSLELLIGQANCQLQINDDAIQIGIRPVNKIFNDQIISRIRAAIKTEASRYRDELVAEAARILKGGGNPCS